MDFEIPLSEEEKREIEERDAQKREAEKRQEEERIRFLERLSQRSVVDSILGDINQEIPALEQKEQEMGKEKEHGENKV